jgi:putative transposase
VYLTETTVVKPSDRQLYKACDELCFKSKNLYNAILYIQRQNYQEGKKYISAWDMDKLLRTQNNFDFYEMNTGVSNYVIQQLDENYDSYFSKLESRNEGKHNQKVSPPHYKDPIKGRNVATFPKGTLLKRTYNKEGLIHLSKTNIKFKSKIPLEQIHHVKVVPKNGYYKLQVVYTVEEAKQVVSENYAAIDLGLNNLATVVTNVSSPMIINGRPLKSINHHWNKKKAKYQSKLSKGVKTSKKIKSETNKRTRRVDDYLHKASRALVNELIKQSISKVVIGYNDGWKKNIKLGKRNHQNFIQIPHSRFVKMIIYKCMLAGIEVVVQEESYTSKCSFLDNESVEKHDSYMGKRVKRGLFMSSNGTLINADVNGAYNILKKHLGIEINTLDLVQVCSIPKVLKF